MKFHAPAVRATWLALVVSMAVAGCASQPTPGASPSASVSHRPSTSIGHFSERLYFGRSIPGGGEVTEAQWAAFVADTITPRFPAGFTIWRSTGNWRGDDGVVVQEAAMVFEVCHFGDAAADRALAEIADTYIRRFNQEAVLRVRTPATTQLLRR